MLPFSWLNWQIWLGLLNFNILLDLSYPLGSTHGSLMDQKSKRCSTVYQKEKKKKDAPTFLRFAGKEKFFFLSIPKTEGNSWSSVTLATIFSHFFWVSVLRQLSIWVLCCIIGAKANVSSCKRRKICAAVSFNYSFFVLYTFIFTYWLTVLILQALLPKICFTGKQQ